MKNTFATLSDRTEFILIIGIGFGYFIFSSLTNAVSAFQGDGGSVRILSDADLINIVVYELIALGVIFQILRMRGWRLRDFNPHISLQLTAAGMVLAFGFYVGYVFLLALLASIFEFLLEAAGSQAIKADALSLPAIVAVSIINPVYEEGLVVGYVVAALKERKGLPFAINMSVLLRVLYHLDQGPLALVGAVLLGLLFVMVYVRWQRLWPLVCAHAVLDFLGLSNL